MQRLILRSKNKIAAVSGLLLAAAFIHRWTAGSTAFFEGALIIASFLGVLPIALQAYQALRVKVVTIDLLVTLAVLGAWPLRTSKSRLLSLSCFCSVPIWSSAPCRRPARPSKNWWKWHLKLP